MVGSQPSCANNPECQKDGKSACTNCRLVLYCSAACQKSHWQFHRTDCRSELNKLTWLPSWVLENRSPKIQPSFGPNKDFIGDMPAFDLINLADNEGRDYDGPLGILFAASGDLRNVVKTISELPEDYNGLLEIVVNDHDTDIVCRNVILLLLAIAVQDDDEAVESMIHVWYSAFIRESDIELLEGFRPLVERVCTKYEGSDCDHPVGEEWDFEKFTLVPIMKIESWNYLLTFLEAPFGYTPTLAHKARTLATKVQSRADYRERFLYNQPPARRLAYEKFCDDGMVLPFGASREEFCIPNPTFFQHWSQWPMKDDADPMAGWPSEEVFATYTGPATADVYGKLFFYLRRVFKVFRDRLRSLKIIIEVAEDCVTPLSNKLNDESFDRIDVSNLSDPGLAGIKRTLNLMVPLLKQPSENPHATLVTLFMSAVTRTVNDSDRKRDIGPKGEAWKRLKQYMPVLNKALPSISHADCGKLNAAIQLVANYDSVFDRYMEKHEFAEAAESVGAAIKSDHTIVDKWPFKVKLRPGQPGAQEEFERRLRDRCLGQEHYVEWKRVAASVTDMAEKTPGMPNVGKLAI